MRTDTPHCLSKLSACIWSKLSRFLLVMAAGPCFLLTWGICKFYASIIWSLANPTLVGISRTPSASKNRQILIGVLFAFNRNARNFFFFFFFLTKSKEPIKNFILPCPFLGLDLQIWCCYITVNPATPAPLSGASHYCASLNRARNRMVLFLNCC